MICGIRYVNARRLRSNFQAHSSFVCNVWRNVWLYFMVENSLTWLNYISHYLTRYTCCTWMSSSIHTTTVAYWRRPIIINIFFEPQHKTKQKSQITNYKLLLNLESAVYRLKCRKKRKLSENFLIEVTRLHHSYMIYEQTHPSPMNY